MKGGNRANTRVLYVEDDIEERKRLVDFLRLKGYIVDTADDGPQALAALRSSEYDLVILDVMMAPGNELKGEDVASGFETGKVLLRKLREEMKSHTPVIVLTAHPGAELENQIRDLGVAAYLNKPIAPDDLETAIADALEETVP